MYVVWLQAYQEFKDLLSTSIFSIWRQSNFIRSNFFDICHHCLLPVCDVKCERIQERVWLLMNMVTIAYTVGTPRFKFNSQNHIGECHRLSITKTFPITKQLAKPAWRLPPDLSYTLCYFQFTYLPF